MKYQAHRGVSSEFPENTMAAFRAAVAQGYDYIELDPAYTSDGQCVVMHDKTLNRTCRTADGQPLPPDTFVNDVPFDVLSTYDAGFWKARKFKGEKVPLLKDVLEYTGTVGIPVKIDNKVETRFTPEQQEDIFDLVAASGAVAAFTVLTPEFAARVADRFPGAPIHYDGYVSEEKLQAVKAVLKDNPLTVWLGLPTPLTSWVKVPLASQELCRVAKQYGDLGIWILDTDDDRKAALSYGADLAETTGTQKPDRPLRGLMDMHVHTRYSHDSSSDPRDLCERAKEIGLAGFTVTDHCNMRACVHTDVTIALKKSLFAARQIGRSYPGLKVLAGMEIGEGFWYPQQAQDAVDAADYDVVIGSVHDTLVDGRQTPYSKTDFSLLSDAELDVFLQNYFATVKELLVTQDFDVLAHLTCPVRTITGKYGRTVDLHKYEPVLDEILQMILDRHIALEVNTSATDGSYGQWLPEEWIVRRYREMGGYLITVASDAHKVSRLALGFDGIWEKLKAMGFPHLYYYEKRIPMQYDPKEEN